jgi:hypothetical protein
MSEAERLAVVADNVVALQAAKAAKRKPGALTATWAGALPLPLRGQYVVKGLMASGIGSIYGASNSGKTAIALDIACHVSSGRRWRGMRTAAGLVVWLALEAPASAARRLHAWATVNGADIGELKLALVSGHLDLLHRNSVAALAELLAQIEAEACEPILLLVIDTLARAIPGANENDSESMGAAVAAIERLRAGMGGASVVLIHHTGKDVDRGPRGHSSLLAALDTALEVRDRQIIVSKARDAKIGEALAFDLRPVEVGRDEDSDAVTAVVAVPADAPQGPKTTHARRLSDGARVALKVFRELLRTEGLPAAEQLLAPKAPVGALVIELSRWRDGHRKRYGGAGADADATGAERQAWRRALRELQAASIIVVDDALAWANDRQHGA